jgi:hypothetical protein
MRLLDPYLGLASSAILVCEPPDDCNGRSDYQIALKAA